MKAYTVREIAGMLGLSKGTVNNRIKDGSLKSLKIGRARRITQEQFDAYLEFVAEQGEQAGPAAPVRKRRTVQVRGSVPWQTDPPESDQSLLDRIWGT